jgi:hypothetical protein
MSANSEFSQLPQDLSTAESLSKRHIKINEITYQNNLESDYTEKIETLDREFKYAHNCDHPWGPPELTLFYGTPLYDEASPTQKLALNHLFWASQYEHVASSESSTILYNQVTAGVFDVVGGYSTLCKTLDLETHQERYHVHAFNNIAYKTKQEVLANTLNEKGAKFFKESSKDFFELEWADRFLSDSKKYNAFRYITSKAIKDQEKTYSPMLKKLEERNHIPALQTGYIGEALPRPALQFITYNWGSSPFLACQHYVWRYMGNASLKAWEYYYVKYYRELEKQGAFIPAPTAVSYFHLMDESFHTTTSQLIARDLYQDFPEPTVYETVAANLIHYFMQRGILSHLSGGIPSMYRSDSNLYPFYYRILRSPIFDMSPEEALKWMEKSLCQEHEGFHCNMKMHHSLLGDLQRISSNLEYLWPINREYRLMASGGSINKAINNNIQTFRKFRKSVAEIS